jgi:anti-sigma regulatory factor (Ser/Thr protein kinase)
MSLEIFSRLVPDTSSVKAARDELDGLRELMPEEKFFDTRLVVSELVTNSLLHAGLSGEDDFIALRIVVREGSLSGEVRDTGKGFRRPDNPAPRSDMSGGWGLSIVENVCESWGVRQDETLCVWFEIVW